MYVKARHVGLFLFLWMSVLGLRAQVLLKIESTKKIKYLWPAKSYKDSTRLLTAVEDFSRKLKSEGYWNAQLSRLEVSPNKSNVFRYQLQLGEATFCRQLHPNAEAKQVIEASNIHLGKLYNSPFSFTKYQAIIEEMLGYCEDHGYPFTSIKMEDLQVEDNKFEAHLILKKGEAVGFDSITVKGELRLNPRFLQKYLGIERGKLFDQGKVDEIAGRLQRFSFVKVEGQPKATFSMPKATIQIPSSHQKVDQVDGILGLVPDPEDEKKMQLTGQVVIDLHNLFNRAILLQLLYQKLKPTSEKINLSYEHPAIFGPSIDAGFSFALLREDTSFVNISRKFTLSYFFAYNRRLNVFVDRQTSQLGYSPQDTATELPQELGKKYTGYGAGYTWHSLDDLYAPKAGWSTSVTAMIGNKIFIPDAHIERKLYNDLPSQNTQVQMSGSVKRYWHWHKRHVLHVALKGAMVSSPLLFRNDLLRLGGLKSLRGFAENQFFVSQYAVLTVEPRFLLGQDAYFFAFYDQSWYRSQILDGAIDEDQPSGFGLGVSFKTKVGLFSFVYALGKDRHQGFDLNRSNIHFGFVSRF